MTPDSISADGWYKWKFFPPSHQPTSPAFGNARTSLSDNSGVSSVLVKVGSNLAPKTLEDLSTSCKVKSTKLSVVDTLLNDLWGVSRNKLNDGRR
jgi:hypothetical protein